MSYNFDEIIDRRGTFSSKWDGPPMFREALGMDVHWDENTIPLFHADMDFSCPPAMLDALHRTVDHRVFGYTNCLWEPRYYDAVCGWYKKRFNSTVEPRHILYSDGALSALKSCVEAFSAPGDGVIIMRPVYSSFGGLINRAFRKIVDCPLVCGGAGVYDIDWELFEKLCAVPANKIFILCSPANPVGRIWTKSELARLAAVCRKYEVILVSDEVHCDLLRVGKTHVPIIEAAWEHSNIVLINGISKSFNVAGLHCSNAIIPDERLRALYKKQAGIGKPTPFAIAAFISAYDECEDWLDALREYLDGTFDAALALLREKAPKIAAYKPDATYFLWLDFSGFGLSPEQVHERIYKRANVMLQEGDGHDPRGGAHFHRMSICSPRGVILEAARRIADAFSDV